ncbi:hypothetical protein DMJ13_03600 [halophilic archaeon]|nr:hypothetical protein DMJ13_03600 [halophilic archaeon]
MSAIQDLREASGVTDEQDSERVEALGDLDRGDRVRLSGDSVIYEVEEFGSVGGEGRARLSTGACGATRLCVGKDADGDLRVWRSDATDSVELDATLLGAEFYEQDSLVRAEREDEQ